MKQTITRILRLALPFLAVLFCLLPISGLLGLETEFQGIDEQSLFSPNFQVELVAADRADKPVEQLEALYRRFTRPAEQAEIELTIARVHCQRTGLVNQAEAIKWYDKALARDLPLTVQATQIMLRGNMHEQLKQHDAALADYLRGLLICLHFNLPDKWPNEAGNGRLQPPPVNSGFDGLAEAEQRAHRQHAADYRRERAIIRQEQDLLAKRYYYVEAIKRVANDKKLDEAALREACAQLTNRKDRIDEVKRLAKEPNPRPWP